MAMSAPDASRERPRSTDRPPARRSRLMLDVTAMCRQRDAVAISPEPD
jgi:hypothetical protein